MEDDATSSGQATRQPIFSPATGSSYSSTPPSKTSSSDDNAVHQGAAPNISSFEITPASNNSKGKSPCFFDKCETDESKSCLSFSLVITGDRV